MPKKHVVNLKKKKLMSSKNNKKTTTTVILSLTVTYSMVQLLPKNVISVTVSVVVHAKYLIRFEFYRKYYGVFLFAPRKCTKIRHKVHRESYL